MDAQAAKRLADVLAERQDAILDRWTQIVRESLRGRMTKAELTRQTGDLYEALRSALEAGAGSADAREAADLLNQLGELSRSRARQAFSATETAISVFALKEATLENLPD